MGDCGVEMGSVGAKKCNKCLRYRDFSEFNCRRSTKDGYQYTCRPCQTKYRRARRNHFANYSREYYTEHRERCLGVVKKYQERFPGAVSSSRRACYWANRERVKSRVKCWAKNNPEKVREYRRRRRARKLEQLGFFPSWLVRYYRYLQADCCYYCGIDISDSYQVEHLTPLSRGGLHCWSNTVLSCQDCNYRKHTKTLEEFTRNGQNTVGFLGSEWKARPPVRSCSSL